MGMRPKQGDDRFAFGGGETISPPKTTEDIPVEVGLSVRSAQQRM